MRGYINRRVLLIIMTAPLLIILSSCGVNKGMMLKAQKMNKEEQGIVREYIEGVRIGEVYIELGAEIDEGVIDGGSEDVVEEKGYSIYRNYNDGNLGSKYTIGVGELIPAGYAGGRGIDVVLLIDGEKIKLIGYWGEISSLSGKGIKVYDGYKGVMREGEDEEWLIIEDIRVVR